MARFLVREEWFEEIAASSLRELEYTQLIQARADLLFPEYHLVPFAPTVYADDGKSAKPDLALIHRDYRAWWVVEVEMGRHSFERHVLPQVVTLANAKYAQAEARMIIEKAPSLDRERISDVVKGRQPRVMVLVDSPQPTWVERLRPYDVIVTVAQVFRSRLNGHAVRLNGEYPSVSADVLTACHCERGLSWLVRLEAPGALGLHEDERVEIFFEDQVTVWTRTDLADTVYLAPLVINPLLPKKRYVIVRRDDGTLRFAEG